MMDLGNGISFNFIESDVLRSNDHKDITSEENSLKTEKKISLTSKIGIENRKIGFPSNSLLNFDNVSVTVKSETDFEKSDVTGETLIPTKKRNEPRKKPFECTICHQNFTFKTQLKKHIFDNHKGIKSEIFQCKECEKSFSSRWNFQQHEKAHEKAKTDIFCCSTCNKYFKSSWKLQRHERIHQRTKPFECSSCNLQFIFKTELENHISADHEGKESHEKVHENMKNDPYIAEEIPSKIIKLPCSTLDIKEEYEMVTGSDEIDVSNQGLEIPTSNSKIVQDITDPLTVSFHSNETTIFNTREKFQCLTCNKTFKNTSRLQRHESVHERKDLIECSSCNICFTFKTELNDHVFNVHGGKKPKVKKKNHHCEECNKSFSDTWKLQRHEKIHLKLKCEDQE